MTLCTCPERGEPDWNGSHEADCPWWPRNPDGRYLCTPDRPMPSNHRERFGEHARWQHARAKCIGDTSCGAGDRFVCESCGVTWTCWYDD